MKSDEMSLSKCILCDYPLSIRNILYGFLLKCPTCGLITRKKFPAEEPSNLYSEKYFTGLEYTDYLYDRDILQDNFSKYIERIRHFSKGDNLLEIGCAYGLFLKEADKFWNAKGIDISNDATKYAQETLGLDAQCGDFLQTDYGKNTFDIISMWDTIEHLQQPHLYVAKCYDILKQGGIICITTGDIGSVNARLRGRRWRLLHQSTHLFFFSKTTISKMLSRYGFKLISFGYIGQKKRISTILHQIAQRSSNRLKNELLDYTSKSSLAHFSISVNLQDIMFVVGRKI